MTLKEVIALTFAYYCRGQTLQDKVLNMYAGDLADLDPILCMSAYERYRRNPANRTFPLPAQIREIVNPEEFVSVETKARETAARICGAVSKFGWNNWAEAKNYIGPEGWAVVDRIGGWQHICESLGLKFNPTAFQAQLRDQLEGVYRHGLPAVERSIGALPSKRQGGLESMGGILSLIPGEPKEPA